MKNSKLFINLINILFCSLLIFGCSEEPTDPIVEKSLEQKAIESLTSGSSQTWKIEGGGMVTGPTGLNITNEFSEFQLTIASLNSKTYSTKSGNILFEINGIWELNSNILDRIVLKGKSPASEIPIRFNTSGNILTLNFTVPHQNTSDVMLRGDYYFKLIKN
ncbi:MAG: hypothetical protein C0433_05745 [Cyclobacterium sp.]|nr:hypothetical protein [Cyclobacterium sp.]